MSFSEKSFQNYLVHINIEICFHEKHLRTQNSLKESQKIGHTDKYMLKGTVHQMYECVSEVLLHLERMSGIVFTAQRAQIWPKNKKKGFNKMYPWVL